MDTYHLRSHTQVRAPATNRQTDASVRDQSVDNTIFQPDTRVASYTHRHFHDGSNSRSDSVNVPSSRVVPPQLGDTLSSHASTSSTESVEQPVNVDPTVDLVLAVSPDLDHQTDGQDFPSGDTGRIGPPSLA